MNGKSGGWATGSRADLRRRFALPLSSGYYGSEEREMIDAQSKSIRWIIV